VRRTDTVSPSRARCRIYESDRALSPSYPPCTRIWDRGGAGVRFSAAGPTAVAAAYSAGVRGWAGSFTLQRVHCTPRYCPCTNLPYTSRPSTLSPSKPVAVCHMRLDGGVPLVETGDHSSVIKSSTCTSPYSVGSSQLQGSRATVCVWSETCVHSRAQCNQRQCIYSTVEHSPVQSTSPQSSAKKARVPAANKEVVRWCVRRELHKSRTVPAAL
jgi:hypothetical protein